MPDRRVPSAPPLPRPPAGSPPPLGAAGERPPPALADAPRATRPAAAAGSAALFVLLTGVFMASMGVAIVNVAAPRMEVDLGLGGGALQLVVSGYSVAYATLLVTGARLGDRHGHRRLFLGGLAAFTATSLLCGVAWAPGVLVGARVAQGAAAAMMVPQVITVIQLAYRGERRARALALWATVISAGAAVGQVGGGALVAADIGGSAWRPVFLVNVPVGAALLLLGRRALPATAGATGRGLDLAGVALLTATVLAVVVPLVFGADAGWPRWAWACLAAAVPLGVGLVAHLARRRGAGRDPVLDLGLLRRRPVAFGLVALCAQMVAYGGLLFALSLHLQLGLGHSPLRAGLVFAPFAVGFAAASLAAPRAPGSWLRGAPTAGLVLLAGAYACLAAIAADGSSPRAGQLLVLAVAGAGFGCGYSPVIARTVGHVPPASAPDASGLLNTCIQLSFALGVATIGSAFLHARAPGEGEAAAVASGGAFAGASLGSAACALGAAALTLAQLRAERARPGPSPATVGAPATAAAPATR